MRVTMRNFVKIGQMVAKILRFYGFPQWRSPTSWIFKNSNFYRLVRLINPICVSLPNFINIGQSIAEIWRIVDFSRWRLSAMLHFYNCDFEWSPVQGEPIRVTVSNFVKIGQLVVDIAILPFSKIVVAAILDFQKFKFLPADTLGRPNLRKPAKFHQDRPICC